ncbi:MAG: ornithine cyclodeaminase family protein [Gemmatimonadales bacterium]
MTEPVRVLTRGDIERLLDIRTCIDAVESAFRQRGEGRSSPSGVLGLHVERGRFHVKAAMLELSRSYFAAKINANFPSNPSTNGLPTIQGMLVLFDAADGRVLSAMDSMTITTLRTAAASAVAARYLARRDAHTATFIGCGVQARAHVAAISSVRDLQLAMVFDVDREKAERFADEMRGLHRLEVRVTDDLRSATAASGIVVTTTSSTKAFIGVDHIGRGAFVAAVGADNEHKHEIETAVFGVSAVVVDDLEQCATIGDLHHALDTGVVTRGDIRATLAEVVAGTKPGRLSEDEIIVFDSTGVAIEDVAAAAIAYERAQTAGLGQAVRLDAAT